MQKNKEMMHWIKQPFSDISFMKRHPDWKKNRAFLSDLTGGKLNISKGMISRLNREFALKTEPERRSAYADMLLSPVMHTDCTNARETERAARHMSVQHRTEKPCTLPARKRGHEGVKGYGYRRLSGGSLSMTMILPFIIMEQIIRNALPMYCGI